MKIIKAEKKQRWKDNKDEEKITEDEGKVVKWEEKKWTNIKKKRKIAKDEEIKLKIKR